ncbi:KWG Leptospira [compost metagenome]
MKKLITICWIFSISMLANAQKITAFKDKASGKIGFKQDGEVIIPATKYEEWEGYSEGLIAVSKNNKWGFIDLKGNEVIALNYLFADKFHDGLAIVSLKKGKFGFIDKSGAKISEFIYQNAQPFYGGFAAVQLKEKYGFINSKGVLVIECKYQRTYPFNNGLAAVKLNDKWGFVNSEGKEVIDFKYDAAEFFSEGFAAVAIGEKYTFIDKTGKQIIEPIDGFISAFSGGLARFSKDSKTGFMDVNGKVAIEPVYERATDFKDGFAQIFYKNTYGNPRCKYIDQTGKLINDKDYASSSERFSEGFAIVEAFMGGDGGAGVIDQTGKEIIETKYSKITYSSGVFTVRDGNGKIYKFNKEGKLIQ